MVGVSAVGSCQPSKHVVGEGRRIMEEVKVLGLGERAAAFARDRSERNGCSAGWRWPTN